MKKVMGWAALIVGVIFIGLAIWGYAPDRDVAELRAEYGQPPSQYIKLANGQSIHVRDEGPRGAPVILLLHGSNSSLHTWDGWTENLSKDYRVVRYDQPGHGLTGPHFQNDYSATAYSDTAAAVMDKLNIDRYVIAGNSMGGWVAWNHAIAYPDRVAAMILVDASGAPDSSPTKLPIGFRLANMPAMRPIMEIFTPRSIIKSSVETSYGDPSAVNEDIVDRYWDMLLYPGNREATWRRAQTRRVPATAELMASIDIPVLIMWGSKDTLIPVTASKWFDTHIAKSTLITYKDLGHIPMEEAPDRTVKDVRKWLISEVLRNKR